MSLYGWSGYEHLLVQHILCYTSVHTNIKRVYGRERQYITTQTGTQDFCNFTGTMDEGNRLKRLAMWVLIYLAQKTAPQKRLKFALNEYNSTAECGAYIW